MAFAAVAAITLASPGASSAAAARAPAAADGIGDPRLNGFWNIDEAARRESQANTRAELTPRGQEIARANQEAAAERIRRGEYAALAAVVCGNIGAPFFVGTSEPWLLTVNKDAVVQMFERYQLTPRYFYTDGRTLPDLARMPPSSSGYSVARWEGQTLVIETRGLTPGGIQGGGLKGPNTQLVERVSLSPDGNRLTWNFTFTDPELMVRPVTYSIMYDRAPAHTYALTQYCDPNEDTGRLVEAPPQEEGAGR